MFWRFGGYANISTLDSILDKPDVTVEELLDESDLIQELKQQNSKLIEFLRDENVLQRLLQYVIAPKVVEEETSPVREEESTGNPLNSFFGGRKRRSRSNTLDKAESDEESKEEKQRMKYAYVTCELLSSDVWSIAEALLEKPDALCKFWEYLKQDAPLDPVQAGYFTKVNESLFDKKTEEAMDIFKSIDNVVADMLKHVDCPTVMDLLLKIISLERSEGGQGIVDWLQTQNLIPLLLAHISPDYEAATQTSAGDFLKAIITISANATAQDTNVIGPNELTRQLVSEECIEILINDMLRGGNPLTVGVGIVIEVIRKNNSDYDLDNQIGPVPKSSDPIYLGTLLREFAKNVPRFMELITHAKQKKELKVAFGDKIEPLGFDRFKTCELMAELLHCSNMALLNERGSESEVRRRDAERDRLKAEGKLTPANNTSPNDDFGTSVDSQGFHHARAPSLSSDAPEEIRRLEVSNSGEDEFENVTASEALVDDMRDDFVEQEELVGKSLERSPEVQPQDAIPTVDDLEVAPLSPRRVQISPTHSRSGSNTILDPKPAEDVESPTSAGVTEKLNSVGLDEDALMPDSPSHESSELDPDSLPMPPSSIQNPDLSLHSEDRPAPLFANKRPQSPVKGEEEPEKIINQGSATSETTIESDPTEEGKELTSEPPEHEDEVSPFEVDLDGAPVVGDLLKMMFVEHRVVPTILDFFFKFPWNNFLHNVVYDVVQQVFNGQMNRGFNRSLAIDLFQTGRITERIVEGQQASDKAQRDYRMRLGYMGHLTLIAEEVVKFSERHPPELLSQSVLDKVTNPQWADYVDHTLVETRERDNAILGGVRPDLSVGPRQAVLNAVNAAQGYGNVNNALAGLAGNGPNGLDSAELNNTTGSPGGYLFSGSSLLSGFNHGSSDEEDEEMGEEGESSSPFNKVAAALDDSDQPLDFDGNVDDNDDADTLEKEAFSKDQTPPINIPPPLNVPPSRARRQFAARLAARRAEAEAVAEADAVAEQQFARHEDDNTSACRVSFTDETFSEHPRSDDSIEGDGEDVGIIMRKGFSRQNSGIGSGLSGSGRADVGGGSAGISREQRLGRSIFSLEGSGDDDEDEEGDDDEEDDDRKEKEEEEEGSTVGSEDDVDVDEADILQALAEDDRGSSEPAKRELVDVFDRLGIDVKTMRLAED